jgi:hypothetical protein
MRIQKNFWKIWTPKNEMAFHICISDTFSHIGSFLRMCSLYFVSCFQFNKKLYQRQCQQKPPGLEFGAVGRSSQKPIFSDSSNKIRLAH